jgi:ABC-type sugar transport system ATPase subunit
MTTARLHDIRVLFEQTALSRDTLHGVSLEIRHGETSGVLGASGCGKSALPRAIAGSTPLSEGGLRGEIVLLEPIQRAVTAHLEAPSGKFAARVPLEAGVRVGEWVGVVPELEQVHLFDTRSGKRL